jgi:hypothetical protein
MTFLPFAWLNASAHAARALGWTSIPYALFIPDSDAYARIADRQVGIRAVLLCYTPIRSQPHNAPPTGARNVATYVRGEAGE